MCIELNLEKAATAPGSEFRARDAWRHGSARRFRAARHTEKGVKMTEFKTPVFDVGVVVSARWRALPSLSQRDIDWLVKSGISAPAISMDDPPAVAEVVPDGRGQFSFPDELRHADGAVRCVIFLVREADLSPLDLVCWSAKAGLLASWTGRAAFLKSSGSPRIDHTEPISIFRSPLGWLRVARQGLVLVDVTSAARLLQDKGPFRAEDEAHAAELYGHFAARLPIINFSHSPRSVAA